MNSTELGQIAERWIAAFNQHDLEGLLALYNEEAEHYSPKLKLLRPETMGYIKGKQALRLWWRDAFDRLPSLHYRLLQLTPYENRIFMEYVREVVGEEGLQVGELLVVENNLIIASRVYHS